MDELILKQYIDEKQNLQVTEYTEDGVNVCKREYRSLNIQIPNVEPPSLEDRISALEELMTIFI